MKIPSQIIEVIEKLETKGFEAFVVGGCVRDLLLGLEPKDWDVTTNACPEKILKIFPDSVYENEFGTVGVKIEKKPEKEKNREVEIVEVTTYRIESKYSDKRHPDEVRFAKTLKEDLSRRDFTINSMALKVNKAANLEIVDLFGGKEDLKNKVIRAVGKAEDRFDEDALRMMRALRFVCVLGKNWRLENQTFKAICKRAENLNFISVERIRDELNKIILSDQPALGINLLVETGLMTLIIPEVMATIGVKQNRHHYYGPFNTVYKHLLASLEKCPSKKLEVRLATFLHDIGKPLAKKGQGESATFYQHEYIGAKMVEKIMNRLKYPNRIIEKTVLLVKNHMFYYNVDEVGEKGVRRVLRKVGLENIGDLIDVRIGDRLGSGVAKAIPYKLRHFKFMVEKVSKDPISVGQLKINGNDLMKKLNLKPGPKIGAILEILLAEVIDDPEKNKIELLIERARQLKEEDLISLRNIARKRINKEKTISESEIKNKHRVK